eukprot:GHVQ01004354.1.p1 GENE.GHVQ01004354.1~~GHVQ01004354.1.p1  ORF type:complete len:433 (-),score=16.88 GHVQ01004354.1:208-1506(-)
MTDPASSFPSRISRYHRDVGSADLLPEYGQLNMAEYEPEDHYYHDPLYSSGADLLSHKHVPQWHFSWRYLWEGFKWDLRCSRLGFQLNNRDWRQVFCESFTLLNPPLLLTFRVCSLLVILVITIVNLVYWYSQPAIRHRWLMQYQSHVMLLLLFFFACLVRIHVSAIQGFMQEGRELGVNDDNIRLVAKQPEVGGASSYDDSSRAYSGIHAAPGQLRRDYLTSSSSSALPGPFVGDDRNTSSATESTTLYSGARYPTGTPTAVAITWFLYSITLPSVVFMVAGFWTTKIAYPPGSKALMNEIRSLFFVTSQLILPIIMLGEFICTRVPFFLVHGLYAIVLCILYTGYTVLHWYLQLDDPISGAKGYVLSRLFDYSENPNKSALYLCLSFFVTCPLLCMAIWLLSWRRNFSVDPPQSIVRDHEERHRLNRLRR